MMTSEPPVEDAKNAAIAYWSNFQNERKAIQAEIDAISPSNDAQSSLDNINAKLSELEKQFSVAMGFLPSYDQRQCSQQLKELTTAYNMKRTSLAPKSKFAFKPKKAAEGANVAASKPAPAPVRAPISRSSATPPPPPPGSIVFSNLSNQRIILSPTHFTTQPNADVYLSSLTSCIIDLRTDSGQISRLQADKMEDCLVLTGPIKGSALIYGSKNTLWAISSQQVRIHDAVDTDFYLQVGSKPIIESCSSLRFAPYQSATSTEEQPRNFWNEVEDFNWLRQQASPNWAVVEEAERVEDIDGLFEKAKEGVAIEELLKMWKKR